MRNLKFLVLAAVLSFAACEPAPQTEVKAQALSSYLFGSHACAATQPEGTLWAYINTVSPSTCAEWNMPNGYDLTIYDLGVGSQGWAQVNAHIVAVSVKKTGGSGYFEGWWQDNMDYQCVAEHRAYNSGPQYCQFMSFNDNTGALHWPSFIVRSLYVVPN